MPIPDKNESGRGAGPPCQIVSQTSEPEEYSASAGHPGILVRSRGQGRNHILQHELTARRSLKTGSAEEEIVSK